MRKWPSIIPGAREDFYIVVNHYGKFGAALQTSLDRAWRRAFSVVGGLRVSKWPRDHILVDRLPVAVDHDAWMRWFETSDRRIGDDKIGKTRVSTYSWASITISMAVAVRSCSKP